MSNFENDFNSENLVSEFLDKYFYPNCPLIVKERVEDIERQYLGIDLLADFNGNILKIDEKAAVGPKYKKLNDLKTFSMELSFLNSNYNKCKGWLVSKDKETTHYLLCWLDRNREKHYINELEDIYFMEVMLINRVKLLKYIESKYGFSPKDLLKKADNMRNEKRELEKLSGKTRFYMSSYLSEMPVNLLIDKEELRKLALINQIVRPT